MHWDDLLGFFIEFAQDVRAREFHPHTLKQRIITFSNVAIVRELPSTLDEYFGAIRIVAHEENINATIRKFEIVATAKIQTFAQFRLPATKRRIANLLRRFLRATQ